MIVVLKEPVDGRGKLVEKKGAERRPNGKQVSM